MSLSLLQYQRLPHAPGCYLYQDKTGAIIYVGKAKDLRQRVASYFKSDIADPKTLELVKNIKTIDFIMTSNEVEALLLESKLIKQHQPKYNIDLKDDKNYAYIKVTKEEFPRLEIVRQVAPGDKVFGPFTSGEARQRIFHLANKLFKLRVCKKLPKRACLLYHMNLCTAPCINKISAADYGDNVKKAEMLLRGRTEDLAVLLEKEMQAFSARQEYEFAKTRRDQLKSLDYLKIRQSVQLKKAYDQDIIHTITDEKNIYVQMFRINKGVVSSKKSFTFIRDEVFEKDILGDFIQQFYFSHDIPREIIIPAKLADAKVLEAYLANLSGHAVTITVPRTGEKKKLLNLLKDNIIAAHQLGDRELVELKEVLRLPTYPKVIECFDISNLGEKFLVGSMVRFKEGKPDKSQYRRFKVKSVAGQSDFDSMKEVVFRRYYRLTQEKAQLPDLVVVDGGRPQLSAAVAAFKELGADIPLIGLAKQEEEIYRTDAMDTLKLPKSHPALHVLQRARNEAHRFANKYQRLLRSKKFLKD